MLSTASFKIERVFKPKKSILISPVSSITWPSYCVHRNLCPGSVLSSATEIGTQSLIGSLQIIKPQACTPVPLTVPSSFFAYLIVFRTFSSGDSSACLSSGIEATAFVKFILRSLGSLSGMLLHR